MRSGSYTQQSARMNDLLTKFSQAADWSGIMDLARELSVRDDPADVPGLQTALGDPLEARRYAAAYALGFSRRDKRAISPLIRVLENREETPRVRAQAAECLGMLGKRKAIRALIECSTDESAEVRFWCVFAMGQYWWRRRGRKRPSQLFVPWRPGSLIARVLTTGETIGQWGWKLWRCSVEELRATPQPRCFERRC
jgi:hypothetical protein